MEYKQKGLKAVGLFAAVATSMALIVPTVNNGEASLGNAHLKIQIRGQSSGPTNKRKFIKF